MLSGEGFAGTLTRQILFAVHQVVKNDETKAGMNYLKTELPDYWVERGKIIELLDFLSTMGKVTGLTHWRKDADFAALLAGALRNDHI